MKDQVPLEYAVEGPERLNEPNKRRMTWNVWCEPHLVPSLFRFNTSSGHVQQLQPKRSDISNSSGWTFPNSFKSRATSALVSKLNWSGISSSGFFPNRSRRIKFGSIFHSKLENRMRTLIVKWKRSLFSWNRSESERTAHFLGSDRSEGHRSVLLDKVHLLD